MHRSRLTAGDRQRIGRVFEEHRPFVEAVAVQHAGRDAAADVVAEVGLRLCTSLNGVRDPEAIRGWIYRVTISVSRDLHADRARLERARGALAAVTTPHESVMDPDDEIRASRRRDAFRDALERLRSRDKTLICHTLGLNRVPVPDAADRKALSRARQRLRTILQTDPRLDE